MAYIPTGVPAAPAAPILGAITAPQLGFAASLQPFTPLFSAFYDLPGILNNPISPQTFGTALTLASVAVPGPVGVGVGLVGAAFAPLVNYSRRRSAARVKSRFRQAIATPLRALNAENLPAWALPFVAAETIAGVSVGRFPQVVQPAIQLANQLRPDRRVTSSRGVVMRFGQGPEGDRLRRAQAFARAESNLGIAPGAGSVPAIFTRTRRVF